MEAGLLTLGRHSPGELRSLVQLAEESGYDYFWYADEKFYRDVYVGLTVAALATTRIRVGTCVTDPYSRHPALTAMAIATLDELAPGRVELGLGAGGTGFPPMGIRRERPAIAIRDAIRIIRALLTGGPVDYEGELISFRNGQLNFRPRGQVPIVVGSRGHQVLRVGGELADGVMIAPYASKPGLEYALRQVRIGAGRAGRSLEEIKLISRVDVCIADDPAVARATVKPKVALPLWVSYPNLAYLEPLGLEVPPDLIEMLEKRDYRLIAPHAHLVPDEFTRHLAVAGTRDQVIEQLVEIAACGVDQITIFPAQPPGVPAEALIRQFTREILPVVRREVA